ncbi:MAG TPA: UDP-N-acetylmuramoylalanyl-D-glutamyl-2,6-diaminopimelate--D-alanyl-D-alanine ligase [Stellaceae bacterium]|nr:UDP-N-acetylmuramoylalanyl-D-glutamyl-2,6-diaminopimelate--D-alanyl-D-alanine ligase [Stellaceae bacterium]
MTPLWTAAEAVAATGGRATREWLASGVSIDSRSVAPGDLFIALAGPKFDGHDFVAAALAKGAAAALVARMPPGADANAPLLLVADTMAALEELGRASRRRCAAQIIGVTGSVGKTGTKEALKRALERQGAAFASAGSLNNQWGVPLSLARMPRETRWGIVEMGMNHPGEIDALSRLVRPDVAVITTIEPAHLGFFPSVAAIADAKAEIFVGMEQSGAAVLNRDNVYFARLAEAARARGITRILGFGTHPDATVKLIDSHLYATASAVTASVMGEIVDYCIAIPGQHWVMNSLAVLGAVKAAGGDVGIAAAAMSSLQPLDGRGRRHRIATGEGSAELIDESYNASPASMRAALAVLGTMIPGKGGRRIAVLGDMLELGDDAERLHAELAQPIIDAGVALVFTVGPNMRALYDALPKRLRGGHAATSAEMAEIVARRLRPGDIATVKGSFGSRMAEVVRRLLAGEPAAAAARG